MIATKKNKLNLKHFNLFNYIFAFFVFFIIIVIIINPKTYINSAISGLTTFGTKVFPSLFPFFFLTKILIELNVLDCLSKFFNKPMQKLFHTKAEGAYIFIIGLICGYPVSAKITSDLFLDDKLTSNEATSIASFTSTSGPMFVIGTVGAAMFNNTKLGILILICHVLGALATGLVFFNFHKQKVKKLNTKNEIIEKPKISTIINSSMTSSINSILVVGGFIICFFIIIDVVLNLFPLTGILKPLISGGIEMTRGLIELNNLMLPFNLNLIIGTFLISFGGFSIIMQAYYFLSKAKVKFSKFVLIKIVHAIFATLFAFILSLFI